jgi:hypothetical protein
MIEIKNINSEISLKLLEELQHKDNLYMAARWMMNQE